MKPYANESEVLQIEGLTIENRTDRISIHGEIDFTRDKNGLEKIREFKTIIDATLKILEGDAHKGNLQDEIAITPTVTVDNPFK